MENKLKINVIANIIFQMITIISGFIIPKLILETFGSEVNGLVSSINQFLNYIYFIEGGVTGVMMANLYKPLFDNDESKISSIFVTMSSFFKKIAAILFGYSLILAIVYPFVIHTHFSWKYISSLILIISINTLIQYTFAISMRVLLEADRKLYITTTIQIITLILNIFIALLVIKVFPEIHIFKLLTSLTFLIQPIIYSIYVKNNYHLDLNAKKDHNLISQRWDGFGINVAAFIHNNTDIVLLTLLSSLKSISVYSVYFLVVTGLKAIINAISGGIVPTLGRVLVSKTKEEVNEFFDVYEFSMTTLTFFMFTVASLLIVPFVLIYTKGITDTNYNQPLFSILILVAEGIYCIRDPYVNVAYQSGHYKQLTKCAYFEATINIVISLTLTRKLGIIGVAIGTLISMAYRTVYQVWYLRENILNRNFKIFFKYLLFFGMGSVLVYFITSNLLFLNSLSVINWVLNGMITCFITIVIYGIIIVLFFKEELKKIYLKAKKH